MPIKIFTEKGIPKAEPDSSAMGDKQFKKKKSPKFKKELNK